MSASLHEAADAVRRAARLYKSFELAAEVLEKLGSLEQAEKEANARTATAKDGAERAQKALLAAEVELGQARDDAVAVRTQAAADAESIRARADELAQSVEAGAKESAAKILDDAQATAENILARERTKAIAAEEVAKGARAERDAAIAETAQAKAELAEIEDKLARAKEAAAKMLG